MIFRAKNEQALVVNVRVAEKEGHIQSADSQEEFFRVHSKAIYAFALRRCGDPAAAEDISAEVFLEALRHGKRRLNREPLPWLYGIARRKVADHLRNSARRQTKELSDSVAGGWDPHQDAVEAERNAEIRRLVGLLPEDQREALLLHYVEDLSAEDAAVVMGRSVASINSLLQRARQNLRGKVRKD